MPGADSVGKRKREGGKASTLKSHLDSGFNMIEIFWGTDF